MERALSLNNEEGKSLARSLPDPQVFAALYEATFDKLYSVIRYQVHDDATADDITAQVYERALQGFARFDPLRGDFNGWLFGIARNTLREWRRGGLRRAEMPLEALNERAEPGWLPEEVVARREQTNALLTAVRKLPPREQEIIALKFGAGLNNRQIARIVDLSESNVGTILYRSLGRLRDGLEADHE